jgi:hypothetical protein
MFASGGTPSRRADDIWRYCVTGDPPGRPTSMQETPLRVTAAGALVLVASFVNYATHNGYPLLTPEVGLVSLGLLALVAAASAVYAAAGRRLRTVLIVLLCFSAVQINFDGGLVVTALTLALLLLGRARTPLLAAVAATMLMADLVTSIPTGNAMQPESSVTPGRSTDEPVLLHLVVDEHVGIEGFPVGDPDLEAARDAVVGFYDGQGFRLFAGAYSLFNNTVNALPTILNFGDIQPWAPEHLDGIDLDENAYFERLEALGFDLTVYESDYIGYCGQAAVDRCVVYGINDLSAVAASALPVSAKASVVAYGFASLSGVALAVTNAYDRLALYARDRGWFELPFIELQLRSVFGSLSATAAFNRLVDDLRDARPGQAYFAHLLLPHYPYVLAADCTLKPIREWGLRQSLVSSLDERRLAYAEQVRCVTTKIGEALAALADSPGGKRTIVIVHGDHGSRLTEYDPTLEAIDLFTDDDVVASHSTLFAVRAEGIDAGVEERRLPVSQILKTLSQSAFGSAAVDVPDGFVPEVMLVRRDAEPVRAYALPSSWVAD